MPTSAPVYRITDVPLDEWAADGVRLLLVDIEATMGITGEPKLIEENLEHLHAAHENIPYIAGWSNKSIKSQSDRDLVASWGEQMGTDAIFLPLGDTDFKPSPINAHKAMKLFGVTAEETGVVDDKASAGVRGGSFAGLQHRAWTRPIPGNQAKGDRFVRTPLETLLRIRAHLLLTPTLQETLELNHTAEQLSQLPLPEIIQLFDKQGVGDNLDQIIGYGKDDVNISDEIYESLKQPVFRQALKSLQDNYDYYSASPLEKFKAYAFEHGRNTASALTYGRLAIAMGIYAIERTDIPESVKVKLEAALVGLGIITDVLDGPYARGHKHGATERGGVEDQFIDKALSGVIDIFGLLPRDLITKNDILLTFSRDIGMTAIRVPFKNRGIDTKSIKSGKIAMGVKGGAQLFGLASGNRYPNVNKVLQRSSTILKLGSMVQAPAVWIEQHELIQHKQNNASRDEEVASLETNATHN